MKSADSAGAAYGYLVVHIDDVYVTLQQVGRPFHHALEFRMAHLEN